MTSGLQHLQNYNGFKLFYYVLCWPNNNNNTHTYTCNPPKNNKPTNNNKPIKTHTHTKTNQQKNQNKKQKTPTNINKQKTLLCKSVCYSCCCCCRFVCWDQKQHCLGGKSLGKGETITGFSVWQVRVWRSFHTTSYLWNDLSALGEEHGCVFLFYLFYFIIYYIYFILITIMKCL